LSNNENLKLRDIRAEKCFNLHVFDSNKKKKKTPKKAEEKK
jgi:hypothetical protein